MSQQHSLRLSLRLFDRQNCHYELKNHAGCDAGRLLEYQIPFTLQPMAYLRCPGASLTTENHVGFDRGSSLIEDTIPFFPRSDARSLRLPDETRLKQLPVLQSDRSICSLLDPRGWHGNFFHWFLDILPRIFAAEHHYRETGERSLLLTPSRMSMWQSESLYRLRPQGVELASLSPGMNPARIHCTALLARSSHRWQRQPGVPFDALSPADVNLLAERFRLEADPPEELPRRVLIVRKEAASRRLLNEFEVMAFLHRYGFTPVSLEGLSLAAQIALFSRASHLISVHGAGLTNLIHARHAAVFEIFQSHHGIRPEYFQLASIRKLPYFFDVCPPVTPAGDIVISLTSLERFLSATL